MLLHLIYHRQEQAYEKVSSSGKEKISAVLSIMDKFSVSWKAYHELT